MHLAAMAGHVAEPIKTLHAHPADGDYLLLLGRRALSKNDSLDVRQEC